MIYDCFLFFNELDMLEMRLELLYDHVDKFIISECDSTHSGLSKPFYFEINKERYSKYLSKIIYIKNYNSEKTDSFENTYSGRKREIYDQILSTYFKIKDGPETDYGKSHWCRDFLHREYVSLGMDICNDDDIIIFSDLDEFPDPQKLIFDGGDYLLNQRNMIYFFNYENTTESWHGTYITTYKSIKNGSVGLLRKSRFKFNKIENAGWHLTFMGGKERIAEKIKSYSHQEFNNNSVLNNIENRLSSSKDVLGRNINIEKVNMDIYPPIIINILNKFKYLVHD